MGVDVSLCSRWKEDRKIKEAAMFEEKRKAEAKRTGGKGLGVLSGRALFMYDPTMFEDDPDADDDEYPMEDDDGTGEEDAGGAAAPVATTGVGEGDLEGADEDAPVEMDGVDVAVDESLFKGGDGDEDIDIDVDEEDGEGEEEDGEEA